MPNSKIIEAGTKIVVFCETGYAGMDSAEGYVLESSMSEEELYTFAHERALDNAEMYGIYPECEAVEEDVIGESESYSDNIEGWYEVYDASKHDGKITYGNRSEPHFNKI